MAAAFLGTSNPREPPPLAAIDGSLTPATTAPATHATTTIRRSLTNRRAIILRAA
jgi:hypothetical protein